MKIAITGASGYIGGHIVEQALRKGYEVRVLLRGELSRPDWEAKGVEVFRGDVRDETALTPFLAGADYLIHSAAVNSPSSRQQKNIFDSNVEGTKLILRTAHRLGVKKIVHTGSSSTIGNAGKGKPCNEETPYNLWKISTDYERSKYLGEQAAIEAYREEGIPVVIAQPSVCVGPGDVKPTYTGRLIMDVINGKLPAHFDMRHNFVDVRDVAEGHFLVLEKGTPGERYLLCGDADANILMSEWFALICKLTGRKPPRIVLPLWVVFPMALMCQLLWKITGIDPYVRLTSVRRAWLDMCQDNSKARTQLGYSPRPLWESARDELRWMVDNGYLRDVQIKEDAP
jgi:dihydroflavonol-4-reductase